MADDPKRISQLDPAGDGLESDVYPVVQAAGTRKQTRTQLRTAILAAWQTFTRDFLAATSTASARDAINAASQGINADITQLTGLTAALSVTQGGTGETTSTGTGAGVHAVSPTLTGTPLAPTAAVGTNTTQIATTAMVQAAIANKRAWTTYTPSLAAGSGTFTSANVAGKHMVAFGICYWQAVVTITTKGTGANPVVGLPFAALAGSNSMPIPAHESTASGKSGVARINSGLTTATVLGADAVDLAANGATININGSYPVA